MSTETSTISAGTSATPEQSNNIGNNQVIFTDGTKENESSPVNNNPNVRANSRKKLLFVGGIAAGILAIAIGILPTIKLSMNSVSTDDAFVNSHVTHVAPRIVGQVQYVFVDDNDRVMKGDLLVQLDPTPYQIVVEQKKAAVMSAQADLEAANASVHGLVAQARVNRYLLENAIQQVDQKIANLRSSVATYVSHQASLKLSRNNLLRAEQLAPSGAMSQKELDINRQAVKSDEANVDEALQIVYANRVSLGLPAQPPKEAELTTVPDDLDQTHSSVRASLAGLIESAAQLGYFTKSWDSSPRQVIEDFYRQDPQGNIDHIFAQIIPNAPPIKQAEAKLQQAKRDLEKAELDLRYCYVVSEINGVVARRNVNPGNNVQVGESLMDVRSLTEVWIDANFKETQLSYLRIGQRVECEVDMYGSKERFEGRVAGFTMGTGQTLAQLPPQNASGNFVKIVQRLPVRIELYNYGASIKPIFVGLSVTPRVFYKEPAKGINAGEYLQPLAQLHEENSNLKQVALSADGKEQGDQKE